MPLKTLSEKRRDLNLLKGAEIQKRKKLDRLCRDGAARLKEMNESARDFNKQIEKIMGEMPGRAREEIEKGITEHLEKMLNKMPAKDLKKLFKDIPFQVFDECGGVERLKNMCGMKVKGNSKDEDVMFKKLLFDCLVPMVKGQDGNAGGGGGHGTVVNIIGLSKQELEASGQAISSTTMQVVVNNQPQIPDPSAGA